MSHPAAPTTHRLMGASLSRVPGSVIDQLLGMREGICRFNSARGLRTALLFSGGWFIQWHEGPEEAVEEAWRRPDLLPVHGHSRLMHRSEGVPTLAEPLHIATVHCNERPTDVARRIHRIERERELGWRAEPHEIWQSMSAPGQGRTGEMVGSMARRNLVALTSELTEAVDLLKAIAEKSRVPVSYQRFADADIRKSDIGAAYIDLPGSCHTTRIQALSRAALASHMVAVGLAQTHCLVLLTGARPLAAERLAGELKHLLSGSDTLPVVCVMGPCPETRAAATDVLRWLPGLSLQGIQASVHGAARVQSVLDLIAGCEDTVPAELDLLLA